MKLWGPVKMSSLFKKCPHLSRKMRILLVSVQQIQTHTHQTWLISLGLISILCPLCVYQVDTIYLLPVRPWRWQEVVTFFCFSLLCLRMIVYHHQFYSSQLKNCHWHSRCFLLTPSMNKETVAEPVKCSLTSPVRPSLLQDLAAPGGDREDGQSLRHHHYALHRRGPASQCGQITHLLIHAHTCMRVHISTRGQIRHKWNLISRLQRWNSLWCLYAAFYKAFPTVFPL